MKPVFSLALAAVALLGTSSVATAAPYSTLPVSVGSVPTVNGAVAGGSNVASGFGISISALNSSSFIGPGAMTGTADASVSLDGASNGTATIVSTNLLLDDMSAPLNIPGVIGASITVSLIGVGLNIQLPSVTVTNGTFQIDSSTPGSLSLNSGFFVGSGTALGSPVNSVTDLSVAPITVDFADLGASVIFGTADDTLGGDDTTSPGDEITLDWNGASSTFTLDQGSGFLLTFDLVITGSGLSIGALVPEPTSGLFLVSLAAGAGATVRRRRK